MSRRQHVRGYSDTTARVVPPYQVRRQRSRSAPVSYTAVVPARRVATDLPGMNAFIPEHRAVAHISGRERRVYTGTTKPDPVLLQARVDPRIREKANAAADAAGISMAAYLERLIERDQVDAHGCPTWLPPRGNDQQELPLMTA